MAKLAPSDLAQVLSKLPKQSDPSVLVGFETADDAGVMRLTDEVALVQTVDFFTPVADDPEMYGRIAAINSLNDVYAMGGRPISALSIVCFPQGGDWDVLAAILKGGQAAMNEAGVVVIGGHSVDDKEMKFGYAVTGTVDPNKVIRNVGARSGDVLVLTKPLGTGAINTAVKRGTARPETERAAVEAMATSGAPVTEAMQLVGVNACTDITGFGLLGHAFEMAKGSSVTFEIAAGDVPLLPDVLELIANGMLTRGDRNNRLYVGDTVNISASVSKEMSSALYDPQTAGGFLISVPETRVGLLRAQLPSAVVIGRVRPFANYFIEVS